VAVQPNTDPRKHAYEENQGRLRALTDERLASLRVPPDLVVWPEGAFSFDIRSWSLPEHREHGWGPMVRQFLDYQRERGIWLLTGTPDYPPGTDEHFNASTLIDPRGRIAPYYHKMQLVPFTEHFPLDKERFSGLYEMFRKLDISDWSVGRERVVFEHERMRLVSMICFEDVFPDHVRRFVLADVDVILNIGNDYWSLSPVEGRQHGVFALFRAVENRRPVLRTTCSGYTVAVDAAGRIQPGAPEPYTAASMLTRVSLAEKRLTLYTRWGDWFPAACGLALLAAAALRLAARLRARWALRAPRTRWRRDGGGAIMGTAYAGTSRADDSLSVTLAAALAGPGCGHGADLS
jgi:apolipoprotein N-acyltransferase